MMILLLGMLQEHTHSYTYFSNLNILEAFVITRSVTARFYPRTGAVASMFWVDAELGSEIYLDGKKIVLTFNLFW